MTSRRFERPFDQVRLEQYLTADARFSRAAQDSAVRRRQSNPTYLLETPAAPFVMRKKPPGMLLQSAHQVEREFRIIKALATTDVPVPRMHILCEDADVIGTPFFVMDYVAGRIMRDPMMPN